MSFGENLKHLMRSRGISGETLGKVVGKGKSAISTWANNTVSPSINDLILIRDYFKIDLDLLIAGSFENVEFQQSPQNPNNVSEPKQEYAIQKIKEVTFYIEKECKLTGSKCAFEMLPELKVENEKLKAENEKLKKKTK